MNSIPFYQGERLAIFIDGTHLYSTSRNLDFDVDYRLLLDWGIKQGRLIRAFYYTTLSDDQDYTPIRPLADWLNYNGYKMITKRMREYTDHQGRKKSKASIDIDMAVDMMEMAEHADHIILFSGESDLKRLVEAVQRKGVRVTVVSTIQSNPPMISDDLRRQADHFLDLDDLADCIIRDQDDLSAVAPQKVSHKK